MGSNYKSGKTELIAIYRLEFYKNKKNWKLCQDSRKEALPSQSPKTTSKILNETYNIEPDIEPHIEPDIETEQESAHNRAFLHEEPDDVPDIPTPPDPEPLPPAYNQQLCHHMWTEQHQQRTEEKSDAMWQNAEQEWCGAEAEGVPEDIAYADDCDGPCHQNMCPPGYQYEQSKPVEPVEQQLDFFSPAELLHMAEEWLQSNGYPICQEEYAPYYEQYAMLDDSTEFVRGAHGAPHSSEADISELHDCECASHAATLSGRRLARGVQRHASALRRLLAEHAARGQLYIPPTVAISFEECPTRDTDPMHSADCLLAGSHVLQEDTGRGRGRLHQAKQVIGIGMGRPYRL